MPRHRPSDLLSRIQAMPTIPRARSREPDMLPVAVAWLNDEIRLSHIVKALGLKPNYTTVIYRQMVLALREAQREGTLKDLL